jgi:hypothetical protein
MSKERKAEVFSALATNVDSYAWVMSTVLKEKFGTVDSEEEYEKIAEEVAAYSESDEFKAKCAEAEIYTLNNIVAIALAELKELEDVNYQDEG